MVKGYGWRSSFGTCSWCIGKFSSRRKMQHSCVCEWGACIGKTSSEIQARKSARAVGSGYDAHGDSNGNNAAIGKEARALKTVVKFIEHLIMVSGKKLLVPYGIYPLTKEIEMQLHRLVESRHCITIGHEGGVAPLIALSLSKAKDVHEPAAGALWNLAFDPGNALRIVDEDGVPALIHICSSVSEMARFVHVCFGIGIHF